MTMCDYGTQNCDAYLFHLTLLNRGTTCELRGLYNGSLLNWGGSQLVKNATTLQS